MHLNRRGKGLVSSLLASVIWKLTAIEASAPISMGSKVEQEQVELSSVVENESAMVVNDNPMDELKNEVYKQLIEDQHENEISVISVN
jgi:hypothetical protein